jgi:hypothetical protein
LDASHPFGRDPGVEYNSDGFRQEGSASPRMIPEISSTSAVVSAEYEGRFMPEAARMSV